jgi:hypothetical protein
MVGRAQTTTDASPQTEQGYLVLADTTVDSVGLELHEGTWELWLGDGCAGVEAGENVLVDRMAWTLQVVDPVLGVQDGTCQVARNVQRDSVPCAINPSGVCDVAWLPSGRQ